MPGIGFAEMGPGDLSLALGYLEMPRDTYPPEMREARERVFRACRANGVASLEIGTPANITAKLDEGVRVMPATARKPPASAAPTSSGRCRCNPRLQLRRRR